MPNFFQATLWATVAFPALYSIEYNQAETAVGNRHLMSVLDLHANAKSSLGMGTLGGPQVRATISPGVEAVIGDF